MNYHHLSPQSLRSLPVSTTDSAATAILSTNHSSARSSALPTAPHSALEIHPHPPRLFTWLSLTLASCCSGTVSLLPPQPSARVVLWARPSSLCPRTPIQPAVPPPPELSQMPLGDAKHRLKQYAAYLSAETPLCPQSLSSLTHRIYIYACIYAHSAHTHSPINVFTGLSPLVRKSAPHRHGFVFGLLAATSPGFVRVPDTWWLLHKYLLND